MNFNFNFSNLLGTVYKRGNLVFSPDGNTLFSPVGNKISAFDLKTHKSQTLSFEGRFDYTTLALNPKGVLLLAANEDGEVHLISLISKTILQRLRINREISALAFSPDGKQFALAKENLVLIYRTPGEDNKDYNAFGLDKVLKGALDDTISLTWSTDSKVIAVGAKDNTTRLYPVRQKFSNFRSYCLGGHTDPIITTFFEKNSLDCYTLGRNGHLVIWEPSFTLEELIPDESSEREYKKKSKEDADMEEDDVKTNMEDDQRDEENVESLNADSILPKTSEKSRLYYSRKSRHFLRDVLPKDDDVSKNAVDVTCADYHTGLHLLVTGFSNGVFVIHEMPDVNMIHSLSISDNSILTVTFNPTGDWIGFGCSKLGQLLV